MQVDSAGGGGGGGGECDSGGEQELIGKQMQTLLVKEASGLVRLLEVSPRHSRPLRGTQHDLCKESGERGIVHVGADAEGPSRGWV
jgi:hypothetical protein